MDVAAAAPAAAKSLQSCPTLCDPIDRSSPGSPVPGILQARTLEWVAISFSSEWKWKVKVKLLSRVRLLATPWTAPYQAPASMGFSRQEYWSGLPLPSPKWMLNFVKCFFWIYWDDLLIFILHFNVVYHIALQMLNHPYIPKINPSWSWCMILLTYYWIRHANVVLRMFTPPFIGDSSLWFSFLVASLSGFGHRIMLAS